LSKKPCGTVPRDLRRIYQQFTEQADFVSFGFLQNHEISCGF
jgi:hypothetical protein